MAAASTWSSPSTAARRWLFKYQWPVTDRTGVTRNKTLKIGLGSVDVLGAAVGEEYSVYLMPDHEALARGDYERVGFNDTFGGEHWTPGKTS